MSCMDLDGIQYDPSQNTSKSDREVNRQSLIKDYYLKAQRILSFTLLVSEALTFIRFYPEPME